MVQVLPQAQRSPSFSQRLNVGVGGAMQQAQQMYQQHQQQQQQQQQEQTQREAVESLMGPGSANLPSRFQELLLQSNLKQQENATKSKSQEEGKTVPLQIGLQSLEQMRNLRKKGNLGRGSSLYGFFGGETAKDRGEYETLGNSLISYASNIPIRNRLEFEKLAGRISDPSTTDKEAEGILEGLESIIRGSLSQYETPEEDYQEKKQEKVLDNTAMKKIFELSGGDKNEAIRIAKKMGYKI